MILRKCVTIKMLYGHSSLLFCTRTPFKNETEKFKERNKNVTSDKGRISDGLRIYNMYVDQIRRKIWKILISVYFCFRFLFSLPLSLPPPLSLSLSPSLSLPLSFFLSLSLSLSLPSSFSSSLFRCFFKGIQNSKYYKRYGT